MYEEGIVAWPGAVVKDKLTIVLQSVVDCLQVLVDVKDVLCNVHDEQCIVVLAKRKELGLAANHNRFHSQECAFFVCVKCDFLNVKENIRI